MSHTTITTITTLNIPDTDWIKAVTTIFIYELCEMKRKGRRVRRILRTLIAGMLTEAKARSRSELATMKKSSWFQPSVR